MYKYDKLKLQFIDFLFKKKKSVNVLYCDIDCIYYNKKVYDIMFFLGRVLKSEVKKREKKLFIKIYVY